MPIAQFPSTGSGPGAGPTLPVILPTVPLDPAPPTPILTGHVVAIADIAGSPYIVLCGAQNADHPDLFFGVMGTPVPAGGSTVVTGRGSQVAPMLQGGGLLTPDADLYHSTTPGEVTHTAPSGSNQTIVRVGFAISTTLAILTTDFRQEIP